MVKKTKDDSKCKCGKAGTVELHACPYNEELNNDDKPHCNCCTKCCQECKNDC